MGWLALVGVALVGVALLSRRASGARAGGGGTRVSALDAEPSPEVRTAIEAGASAYGVAVYFALANAALESRFRPGAGLNTLSGATDPDGPGPLTAIPERSVGLMQINVNPTTPTGRSRIAAIRAALGVDSDAEVLAALREPAFNVGFWAGRIVVGLRDRALREGRAGDDVWRAVRVWLASPGLSVSGANGRELVRRLDPVLAKWKSRTGGR